MEKICLGGKTLYGGIGDILYFIHNDPILQRIANQVDRSYKPTLSIYNNRTEGVTELFDQKHFSSIIYNDPEHVMMKRPRNILEVPTIIKDVPPSTYPVPVDDFIEPKHPYFVCHLEVMEDDNELDLRTSLWNVLKGLTKGIPTYVLGTENKELPLPGNFIDFRRKTDLRQAYHLTANADRYIGTTSVWYLLSLLLKKPGWSFNYRHEVLYKKLLGLYHGLDLMNSRIMAFDVEYE